MRKLSMPSDRVLGIAKIESTSRKGYRAQWVLERNLPCPSKAHKSLRYRRIGFSPVGRPGLHYFPAGDCSEDFQISLRNSFPAESMNLHPFNPLRLIVPHLKFPSRP